MDTIKIATWNIAGGRKINSLGQFDYDDSFDRKYFVSQIKKINPQVVCIQENHTKDKFSVSGKIAESLGFKNNFVAENSISHIQKGYKLGNAITSSFANTEYVGNFFLPYPDFELRWTSGKLADKHEKSLQIAKFNSVSVGNTQLLPLGLFGYDYMSGDGLAFAKEIESIFFKLAKPCILCGDFSGEFEGGRVDKVMGVLFKDNMLVEALPSKSTRPTKDGKENFNDHIYYSQDNFELIDSDVVKTETDHYLCWAEFKVK